MLHAVLVFSCHSTDAIIFIASHAQTRPVVPGEEEPELLELLPPGSQLLAYTPIALGRAKLPPHLCEPIQFEVGPWVLKEYFMGGVSDVGGCGCIRWSSD